MRDIGCNPTAMQRLTMQLLASGIHYDLPLLGYLVILCRLIGIHPSNGVIPQSLMYTKSLASLEHEMVTFYIQAHEYLSTFLNFFNLPAPEYIEHEDENKKHICKVAVVCSVAEGQHNITWFYGESVDTPKIARSQAALDALAYLELVQDLTNIDVHQKELSSLKASNCIFHGGNNALASGIMGGAADLEGLFDLHTGEMHSGEKGIMDTSSPTKKDVASSSQVPDKGHVVCDVPYSPGEVGCSSRKNKRIVQPTDEVRNDVVVPVDEKQFVPDATIADYAAALAQMQSKMLAKDLEIERLRRSVNGLQAHTKRYQALRNRFMRLARNFASGFRKMEFDEAEAIRNGAIELGPDEI